MARGDGLEDLRTARDLAEQALRAIRERKYADAMALSSVGTLHLGLAELAVRVLAESSTVPQGSPAERAWRRWSAETGGDLR
jgi:hypothetical protein